MEHRQDLNNEYYHFKHYHFLSMDFIAIHICTYISLSVNLTSHFN